MLGAWKDGRWSDQGKTDGELASVYFVQHQTVLGQNGSGQNGTIGTDRSHELINQSSSH